MEETPNGIQHLHEEGTTLYICATCRVSTRVGRHNMALPQIDPWFSLRPVTPYIDLRFCPDFWLDYMAVCHDNSCHHYYFAMIMMIVTIFLILISSHHCIQRSDIGQSQRTSSMSIKWEGWRYIEETLKALSHSRKILACIANWFFTPPGLRQRYLSR